MLTRINKKYKITNWTLSANGEFEDEFRNSFRMPMQFSDAGSFDPWATTSIAFMRARSIIDGVGDHRFNPKGCITREQAIKIAVKMLAVIDNPAFAPDNAWIVDTINGSSLYTWLENGQKVQPTLLITRFIGGRPYKMIYKMRSSLMDDDRIDQFYAQSVISVIISSMFITFLCSAGDSVQRFWDNSDA